MPGEKVKHLILRSLLAATSLFAVSDRTAEAQERPVALIGPMIGTWDVRSRTWLGPNAQPDEQPPATAVRTIPSGGGFLQEVMSGVAGEKPFTRVATLNLNEAEGVYEYASMDTRAPQLMHYRGSSIAGDQTRLSLRGGTFTVASWGRWRNARFAYRVELDRLDRREQMLRIYFQPLAPVEPEFLATQYDYTRR